MRTKNPRPTNDFVFRKLFGTEENKELLIALLNAIIRPAVPIVDVVIKNTFNLADYDGSKETILDVKAMDQDGNWYDIEMQIYPHIDYGKRALYYGARVYVDQLERGSDYSVLNMSISIHILGFKYFKEDERVFRRLVLKDAVTNKIYEDFQYLQFHFVELPKFLTELDKITTEEEQWAAFFKYGDVLHSRSLPATLRSSPAIVKAIMELERIGLDPRQREIYEQQEKKRMIEATQLMYAKQEGRVEGRQEGQIEVLTGLMSRRIGDIPANVMARMKGLSPAQLNDLAQELFDLTSYDDIEAWFTRH